MKITITIEPQSGADCTMTVERPEPRSVCDSRDFSPALVAECLDALLPRVRAAFGIEAS